MADNGENVVPTVRVIPSDRAWFDPRLIVGSTKTQVYNQTLVANVPLTIAKPDPGRILLVVLVVQPALQFQVGPVSTVATNFAFVTQTTVPIRISLWEWPGIVTGSWFAFSSFSGGTFQTIEVTRI